MPYPPPIPPANNTNRTSSGRGYHADTLHNATARALRAIVTELGVNPSREYATVGAAVAAALDGAGRRLPGAVVAAADAPQSWRDAADRTCDGVADDEQLNAALASAETTGGQVLLSPGTFNVSSTVRLRAGTALVGQGRLRATRLRATGGLPAGSGVVELAGTSVEGTLLRDLGIHGDKRVADVHGLRYDNTGGSFTFSDPAHLIQSVYVQAARRDGVHMAANVRAAVFHAVRVIDCDGHGFHLDNIDSFYSQCEAGSCAGFGFNITGSNSRFTNCKAWYSDRSGWRVGAVRNQLAACEAQDNEQHGFLVRSGHVSLSACHADSNSWRGGNANANRYDGFHVSSSGVTLSACEAYDKNEGGRGHAQRYGLYLSRGVTHSILDCWGRNNVSGVVGGHRDGVGVHLRACGQAPDGASFSEVRHNGVPA